MIHEEDRSNENKFSETVLIFFFEPIVKYVNFQLWIGLGICPKKVKFVSNWLEAKEKKHFFLFWKKKLSQKREKILFQKS